MAWQEVVEFLGGTSAISLTIGFLGKKAIEAYLAGRIETYKNNLEKLAREHAIRFQSLHTERADVIKQLYSNLVNLDDALCSTLRRFQATGEPNLSDKVRDLGERFNTFREYFLPRRIFLAESTCSVIDKILEVAKDVFFDITTCPIDPAAPECRYNNRVLEERHAFWTTARETHAQEITDLKQRLEHEFRLILGIDA